MSWPELLSPVLSGVGNDLVVWDAGPNRGSASQGRFIHRVCTPSEQALLASSPRAEFLVWLFWAVKESAYKFVSRVHPTVFSPCRLEVAVSPDELEGTVCFEGEHWPWRASERDGWVHAWVTANEQQLSRVQHRVEPLSGPESEGVRLLALSLLTQLGTRVDRIEGRPPIAFCGAQKVAGCLSLSHDEGYGAVAWLPEF